MKIDIKSLPANSVRIRTAAKRCALHGDCVAVVPVSKLPSNLQTLLWFNFWWADPKGQNEPCIVLGPAQLVGYRDGISEWGGWEVLVEDWQPYDSYDSEAAARETRLYREGQLTELQWQQVKLDWQQTQLDNLGARS